MVYTSYEDLSNSIRRNLWKVPQDVDLIVGVPRSGMIPALMLAELMNKRCADIDAFAEGREMSCGGRQELMASHTLEENGKKKVLVLDDTVFAGSAMRKARERLAPLGGEVRDYLRMRICRGQERQGDGGLVVGGHLATWREDVAL